MLGVDSTQHAVESQAVSPSSTLVESSNEPATNKFWRKSAGAGAIAMLVQATTDVVAHEIGASEDIIPDKGMVELFLGSLFAQAAAGDLMQCLSRHLCKCALSVVAHKMLTEGFEMAMHAPQVTQLIGL